MLEAAATAANDAKATLTVDAQLVRCTPPVDTSKTSLAVDMGIFNEAGEAEIRVEDLIVRAWAHTRPKDDVERYLHTVMDVDPTDEIVSPSGTVPDGDDTLLVESCRRIAAFYLNNDHIVRGGTHPVDDIEGWTEQSHHVPNDTQETIDEMIRNSKHADYLDSIKTAGELNPTHLAGLLPFVEEEARQVSIFRDHVGRILKQIAHRYPWMNILHLATAQTGLDRSIRAAIGDTFQSLTVGRNKLPSSSASHHNPTTQSDAGVQERDIDVGEKLGAQIGSEVSLDLVILPTTLLGHGDETRALKNIGEVMKPGGFLVIVDPHSAVLGAQSKQLLSHPSTPPQWQDTLDSCGFIQQARKCNQSYPAGCVLVRQFREPNVLPEEAKASSSTITDTLLLIHGAPGKSEDHQLVASLRDQLSPHCGKTICCSFDDATAQDLETCTIAVMLADLEEPLMSNMTEHRMSLLRNILRPSLTVLWITRDAREGNPEHAGTLGFLRTIAAEVADLKLQVLDLEPPADTDTESPAKTIAAVFCQLVSADRNAGDSSIWRPEPEIHMENGRRLIPRVLPWKHGNDRFNALRRVVTRPVSTLLRCVELIIPEEEVSPESFRFEFKDREQDIREPSPGNVVIQVEYSSAVPLKLGKDGSAGYVCVGRRWKTGERMVALSGVNSSYVTCPAEQAIALQGDSLPGLTALYQLVRYITAHMTVSIADDSEQIILVAPDVEFARCLVEIVVLRSPSGPKVVIIEPCYDQVGKLSPFPFPLSFVR